MLNGVRDEFVNNKTKRHREIRADDERIGIDCQCPGSIGAARRSCDFSAKVDKVPVKRDRSDVIRYMQLSMNGSYGCNARGGGVELIRGGPGGIGVHAQKA